MKELEPQDPAPSEELEFLLLVEIGGLTGMFGPLTGCRHSPNLYQVFPTCVNMLHQSLDVCCMCEQIDLDIILILVFLNIAWGSFVKGGFVTSKKL